MTGYIKSDYASENNEDAPDIQIAFIKSIYLDHGRSKSKRYG